MGFVACGSDSESDGPSDQPQSSSQTAWVGSTYVDGTAAAAVITFGTGSTGCYRLMYNGRINFYDMTFERNGNDYRCRVNGDVFTISIDGTGGTLYSGGETVALTRTTLSEFYQEWYDDVAASCKIAFDTYEAGGVRFPEFYLEMAQQLQQQMAYVRSVAHSDGVTISQSSLETYAPSVDAAAWQAKYDAQVEVVKGYYKDYHNASDRFMQVAIKSSYESAQSTLRGIRSDAAIAGVTIQASEWENKSINS